MLGLSTRLDTIGRDLALAGKPIAYCYYAMPVQSHCSCLRCNVQTKLVEVQMMTWGAAMTIPGAATA